jgi:hypothetical protein
MLAQSTMQTLFRGLSRIAVFPPPSSSFLATPTMALAYRTTLKTTSQNVNTSLQRGIATSASLGFNSPHRYGNGPLYRNKLSPKDASTRADVSPLRMLMVNIIVILYKAFSLTTHCPDRPHSLANPGPERERSHPNSLQSTMSPRSQQEMCCVRSCLKGPFLKSSCEIHI